MGILNWLKRKKVEMTDSTDELIFHRKYTYYGDYSNEEKFKKEELSNIVYRFREAEKTDDEVSILSKFNNLWYPMFDLDKQEHLNLFKQLYVPTSHVIFKTSTDHYWGILDISYQSISDIFKDHNWKICNDEKYISFSRTYNRLFIRFIRKRLTKTSFILC